MGESRAVDGPQTAGESRTLTGWGRIAPSCATVLSPRGAEELVAALRAASPDRGGVIARGAGRSYGDAAQNGGGTVLDLSGLRGIELLGGEPPLVRAGAGTTLGELVIALAPHGLSLPVVPGTRHVTVGGAIGADIHGKNHFSDGSFGTHVDSVRLCTPDGQLVSVSRESDRELFEATIGGMGLTGVVVDATLRPRRGVPALLDADIDRTPDLAGALALLSQTGGYRYAIAWVDLLRGARGFGRSVVMRSNDRPEAGDGSGEGGASSKREQSSGGGRDRGSARRVALPGRPRLRAPERLGGLALRPAVVRAFNELRWHGSPERARGAAVGMGEHFFPLDALGCWSRLYGSGGLIQYQFVVPESRGEVIGSVLSRLRAGGVPMYLAVIKRFGAGSGGMLSFPMPGFTLAVDVPAAAPGLGELLDRADEEVAAAGGRVYLAKDARLRGEMLQRMYPQLQRFNELRGRVDPDGVMRSDMAGRLGLAGVGR